MKVSFEIPELLASYVDINDPDYHFKVKELMMYTLIQENKISHGKAAELLGIGKMQLITDLGKSGLPYFDQSFSEVLKDANVAGQFSRNQ